MADAKKRTGGDHPVFDSDRAWERFERQAAQEPASARAFWLQAETGKERIADEMKPAESEHGLYTRQSEAATGSHKDIKLDYLKKDGAVGMKQTTNVGKAADQSETDTSAGTVGATGAYGATGAGRALGAYGASSAPGAASTGVWRTERPARRRLRRLTIVAAGAVLVVGLFATSLGDRVLAAMQQTFRIQSMVGVGISADDLASISNLLEKGSPEGDRAFSLAQYGTLSQSGGGAFRDITWEEAERQMGAPLLRLDHSGTPSYQPATTLTFNLQVEPVNRLLTRLGSGTTLPAAADGKAIRLHIPGGIATEGTLAGGAVRLLQFGKPELTMEDGIDATAVRDAVLGMPVLPESLRSKLAAIGDWQSTLPVPARDGATRNLQLGGHDAVMTESATDRFLLWLDGDRMVLLGGDLADFPTEAAFLQAAEALIRP